MCDSVVVTGLSTADGTTLFAKNSDRHAEECQPFVQHPAAYHPRGATVRCTHTTISQVAETYRVMGHSPWWVWGFEHGVNEYGVAIGNQAIFSREPVETEPGLIGMDLVRLGLERGRDAREALEVIAGLLESHGQGGEGFGPGEAGYHNSFMLADPEQAWIFETFGRRWAARRVDDVAALTNHITLDSGWEIGSRDLEATVREAGWWTQQGRVDVAEAFRNPAVPGFISEGRLRRSQELLQSGRGKHDAASMMELLRDHGGPGELPPVALQPDEEARYTLCMHGDKVGTTTASLVAPLPTDRTAPWPVWVSFASPCTGFFIPVYIDGVIPAALAQGGQHADGGADTGAWWTFHQLHECASRDYAHAMPILTAGWRALDERIESDRVRTETDARALAVAGERVEAAGVLSDFMSRTVDDVLARAVELREAITR